MANFKDILDKLIPEIETVSKKYNEQVNILNSLNTVTTELLNKYTDSDGVLENLDNVKDKINDSKNSLIELNKEYANTKNSLVSFSDALKLGKDDMDDSMNKISSMLKNTTGNFGKLIGVAVAGTNKFKDMATAASLAAKRQNELAISSDELQKKFNNFNPNSSGSGGDFGSGGNLSKAQVALNALKAVGKSAINLVRGGFEQITKLEEAFRPLNAQMGLSAENQKGFMDAMNQVAVTTTAKFGKSAKDLAEIQGRLFSETGRIQVMSAAQTEKVAAMARLVGNQSAAGFVADMDKVGASTSTAAKNFESIRVVAGKVGVDMVKATSLVQSNIQKAQSYAFKNGVNSLAQMATKSLQMRMNMEQVFKFSEANRSVESAVTQAAQTQVLGGAFSTFANPLENLYNSLYDQEASQQRLLDLGSDVMRFDKESGTMRYKSASDQLRAEAFAKSSGLDINELQSGWTRVGLGKQIENDLGSQINLQGEDREFAKSQANWNKEMNAWTVSLRTLNEETGKYEYKDTNITQLTKDDLELLKPDVEQNVDVIARTTMTINDRIQSLIESTKQAFGAWVFEKFGSKLEILTDGIRDIFLGFSSNMKALIGGAVVAGGPLGGLAVGGIKSLGGKVFDAIKVPFNLQKGSNAHRASGASRGTIAKLAGRGALNMGKSSGVLAGVISAITEGVDQYQQGNFKSDSGKQGVAIGSTAGAGVGGGLGAWGGMAAGAAVGSVVPVVGTAIGGILGAIVGGIAGSKFGKTIGNAIGDYFDKGGGKAIVDASKKVWGNVSAMGTKTWETLKEKSTMFGKAASTVWDNISVKGKQVGGLFSSLFSGDIKGAAANMTLLTKNILNDTSIIYKKVSATFTSIMEGVGNGLKEFGGWITTAWGKVTSQEWWGEQISGIINGVKNFFGPIVDWFGEKVTSVKEFITNTWENITNPDWWVSKITAIKDGVVNGFTSIIDWVKENLNPVKIFQKGWDATSNFITNVNDKVKDFGKNIGEGIKTGNELNYRTDVYTGTKQTNAGDMIKTPQGSIYTDPNDVIMAVKPGGSLSTFFANGITPHSSNISGNNGNVKIDPININISGSIRLEGTNQSINIDSLATNRQFINGITQAVAEGINRNMNSGRPNNSTGLQFGNFQNRNI